ncbi:asparaginase [Streptomyces sp. NBC_01335]|uniref:amino acid--tRNA ligase-related protein n=1 Tax=Streptomyces sp. NBC_01335 TaxID=2903828 RepID=UPI002E0FD18A|nr:asparaginase [Streptomyces sp. NBC_01335]
MPVTEKFAHGGWRPAADRFIKIMDDPFYRTLIDLQDLLTVCTTEFWHRRTVKALHLPITTGSVSSPMGLGSDSVPVEVDLFGQHTYLADSMQFMLEYGCRFNPSGAWYLMPSFRGEDADETHLNQFFHSEAEITGGLDDVIEVVDDYLRTLARAVLDRCASDVGSHAGGTDHIAHMAGLSAFPRMTFDEAVRHLGPDPLAVEESGGWRTLTRHGERRLMTEVSPVLWVTHFDHLSVPFYQAYGDAGRRSSLSADLLFGIGEVVGAGERHATGAEVRAALSHHNVPEPAYQWYVDMKDVRPMRTSGFGLGVERWLLWVLNRFDIREMQLAPRLNGVAIAP